MDLGFIVALLMSLSLAASIGVVFYVGIRRLMGRRSRLDGMLDRIATAQDAGIYPPALRGESSHTLDAGASAMRAANTIRHTPARKRRRRA